MGKGRVLVVDDESIVRRSCERVLSPEGYDVVTISRGDDAVDLLEKEDFDIVLTDLKMPYMDGLDLLNIIKNRWPSIEVIVITGYSTPTTAIEAKNLGAYEFIEKPFNPEEILSAVNRAMKKIRA
jgi:DNA-binding NtrC family response regulator